LDLLFDFLCVIEMPHSSFWRRGLEVAHIEAGMTGSPDKAEAKRNNGGT
jgi:hypothetical protein